MATTPKPPTPKPAAPESPYDLSGGYIGNSGDAVTGQPWGGQGVRYGLPTVPGYGYGFPQTNVMAGADAATRALNPDTPTFYDLELPYMQYQPPGPRQMGYPAWYVPPSFFDDMAGGGGGGNGPRPEGRSGEEQALLNQLRGLTDEEYALALAGFDAQTGQVGTQEGRVRSDLQTHLAQLGRQWQQQAEDVARAIDEYRARQGFTRGSIDYSNQQIDYTRGVAGRTEARRPQALEDTRTGFSARGLEFGGQKNRGVTDTNESFNELARQYAQSIRGTQEQVRGYEETLRQYAEGIEAQEIARSRGEKDYQDAISGVRTEADRALEDLIYRRGELERGRTGAGIAYRGEVANFDLARASEARQLKHAQAQWEAAGTAANNRRSEMTTWLNARVRELERYGADPGNAQTVAIMEARAKYPEIPDTYIAGAQDPKYSRTYQTYGVDIGAEVGRGFSEKRQKETRAGETYTGLAPMFRSYLQGAGPAANIADFINIAKDQWVSRRKAANAGREKGTPAIDYSEGAYRNWVREKYGAFAMLALDGGL